ncbi:unnamed protein product [Allacma fusca]|uniref:CRAL-TRIO domain-containing protein n=1 Tax=Allacma fusca TaxID=39272 RepID=A0A8J2LDT7_9HEXA|nr:unnamed protein product [Allacma fusca]
MSTTRTALLVGVCLAVLLPWPSNAMEEEDILKWDPPTRLKKRFPYYKSGEDLDGAEVWIVPFGKWDDLDIVNDGGQRVEDYKKYYRQMYTRMSATNRNDDFSKHSVVIMDMDGFNQAKALSINGNLVAFDNLRTFQAYARNGGFKKGIIVNVNPLFEALLNLGKPILGRLGEFLDVYGTNSERWIPRVLKEIPADQLPKMYGGSKAQEDLTAFGR